MLARATIARATVPGSAATSTIVRRGAPSGQSSRAQRGAAALSAFSAATAAGGGRRPSTTAALVARAYHVDRTLLPRLLEVPELSSSWRDWAEKHLGYAHP
jgi:hypothetical protein